MISIRLLPALVPFAAALALSACSGEGAPPAEAEAALASDSIIKPIVQEPLTEADLMDLAQADLSLELPWTRNRVSRDPAPAQGPAWLESVKVSGGEGFDRTLFTFADVAFYPGYEVGIVDAGAQVACGEEGKPLSLSGDRAVVVRFLPASTRDGKGARMPARTRSLAAERFTEGGLVCDLNDNVVWAAGLSGGDQVRVLELRNPKRLAVDVR